MPRTAAERVPPGQIARAPSPAPIGKVDFTGPAAADLPIDPLRLRDWLEAVVETADCLGGAEQQNAALAQREME